MNPLIINNYNHFESPIIVALDFDNELEVTKFISQIEPNSCKLKIGKELFTTCGPKLVEKLVVSGFDIFLDLKYHDIPNTVYKACRAAANLGVWMLNVHASGGEEMLNRAKEAIIEAKHKPLLIAVTLLTSMDHEQLKKVGVSVNLNDYILNLANLSYKCGLDGVVCSALDAPLIKNHLAKDFLVVSPGIRINNLEDDQKRIMTPINAIKNGVDYLVIGRPITKAIKPNEVIQQILSEINQTKRAKLHE
ncbi:MAG TPA: orotidine-5'-phosphate decarboxylase [Burkholderiales bacterium]|nr:orotidine-5'-phosphate decarboxylase [Burkholderiales bacterium]